MTASNSAAFSPSLAEIHGTIRVGANAPRARKLFAFAGPGYLVAAGYMDPGNWATAVAAGSGYGYTLLWIVLAASLVAMLFQALCVRLGLGAGLDLAQACRRYLPRRTNFALWLLAELAIVATDLAELIGAAIALKLLFDLPLVLGVLLTALDAFLVLWLMERGVRWVEAFVASMIALVGAAFAFNVWLAKPDIAAMAAGLLPSLEIGADATLLLLATGIIGATVMPHNLYLHSALVQSRSMEGAREGSASGRIKAIRYATADSCTALILAMFVNGALLVLAASAFHAQGLGEIAELGRAFELLAPALGTTLAATAFAVALLACGLNSTITGTLAGQVVMEGFLRLRLAPWLRRLATRAIAIVPAAVVVTLYGDAGLAKLLVASQVVLSLQLPFAVVPLVAFAGSRRVMGELAAPRAMVAAAWLFAGVILLLNGVMLYQVFLGKGL
ncbi:MAG: Nramp family divalent metal transporter [Candidatus Parcubacteria bacterium]|nr:Nramp family divalent metal transporter [Burkholderiales bacterium]